MKTFINTTILLLLLTILIYPQSITNTLDNDGFFYVKDASTTFLTLQQSDGYLGLGTTPNQQLELSLSLRMPNTSSSTTGVIYKGTEWFLHNYEPNDSEGKNTFLGLNSGNFDLDVYGSTFNASYNTGLGANTLYTINSGGHNTAVGYNALTSLIESDRNTAVGSFSLSALNGSYANDNTAVGYNSLLVSTTGYNNTAVGNYALDVLTEGHDNTFIGKDAGGNLTTGDWNIGIGVGSNQTPTGDYNIGIGGGTIGYNSTGSHNIGVGTFALSSTTTGSNNVGIGQYAGRTITTGSNNTAIGYFTIDIGNFSGDNVTCIGNDAQPSARTVSNEITLGDANITSLRCNVTSISSLSDKRDKKNIKDLELGLDFLMKIKPRQFNWDKREWYENNTSDGTKMKEEPTAGFIAQEFDEVQNEENAEWLKLVYKSNPDKLEATYGNLLPVMVKAIQELKEQNDKLVAEINELKNKNRVDNVKNESIKETKDALSTLLSELK